jgi:hypothetical protein
MCGIGIETIPIYYLELKGEVLPKKNVKKPQTLNLNPKPNTR